MISAAILAIVAEHLFAITDLHFTRSTIGIALRAIPALSFATPVDLSPMHSVCVFTIPTRSRFQMRVDNPMRLKWGRLYMHNSPHGIRAGGIVMLPFAFVASKRAIPVSQECASTFRYHINEIDSFKTPTWVGLQLSSEFPSKP